MADCSTGVKVTAGAELATGAEALTVAALADTVGAGLVVFWLALAEPLDSAPERVTSTIATTMPVIAKPTMAPATIGFAILSTAAEPAPLFR